MKHNNISIFIPHEGCKHMCSFCNQKTISSTIKSPEINEVKSLLKNSIKTINNKASTEIAFFGGSFTAIDREYMISLLKVASEFVGEGKFSGIRVSTRPDAIDSDVLKILKSYNVTSIELGAQSMCDDVLLANDRGHNANDVIKASKLIKEFGFSLGLQMMVGLYKDTVEKSYYTATEFVKIHPDTVRIYPTVILNSTKLASLYKSGEYKPVSFEDAVDLCADLLILFKENNIKVIKLGLHASLDVEKDMVGGIYHPAFRELCESRIYYKLLLEKLRKIKGKNIEIYVRSKDISKMIGQRKNNIEKFTQIGYNIKVYTNDDLNEYEIEIKDVPN